MGASATDLELGQELQPNLQCANRSEESWTETIKCIPSWWPDQSRQYSLNRRAQTQQTTFLGWEYEPSIHQNQFQHATGWNVERSLVNIWGWKTTMFWRKESFLNYEVYLLCLKTFHWRLPREVGKLKDHADDTHHTRLGMLGPWDICLVPHMLLTLDLGILSVLAGEPLHFLREQVCGSTKLSWRPFPGMLWWVYVLCGSNGRVHLCQAPSIL